MIDLVYKTLLTVINKDNQGYVTPTEFNLILNNVQLEIFRSYFEDENRDKTRFQMNKVGRGYSNLAFNQRQMITQFSEYQELTPTLVGTAWTTYTLPEDLYFIEHDGVTSDEGKIIEEVERNSVSRMVGSEVAPTELYPIYEDYGNDIWVYPASLNRGINVRYIRKPAEPKWTYTVVGNIEMFNPSAADFQDIELHESEFSNIVIRLLSYFGINLRESEVIQIAEMLKDKQNLKDNS